MDVIDEPAVSSKSDFKSIVGHYTVVSLPFWHILNVSDFSVSPLFQFAPDLIVFHAGLVTDVCESVCVRWGDRAIKGEKVNSMDEYSFIR